MQLHCLHVSAFAFESRTRDAEAAWGQTEASVGDCVVVFVAVETGDGGTPEQSARAAADRIEDVADHLGERTVVLVPCPQLSDSPADGAVAEAVFRALDVEIERDVHAVAPGYDVAFELDARGHPFASQHVRFEAGRRAVDSDWVLVSPAGSAGDTHRVRAGSSEGADLDDRKRGLVEREGNDGTVTFGRIEGGPALFEDSTGAIGGRLLPAGVLLRDLLTDRLKARSLEYGAVPVESYGREHSVLALVGEQHLEAKELPLPVFSARGFDVRDSDLQQEVPTLATLVVDTREALDEVLRQAALLHGLLAELGLDYEPVIRTESEFYADHSEWVSQCVAAFGQSVLVERRPAGSLPLEIEFAVLDSDGSRLVAPSVTLAGERPGVETAEGEQPVIVRSTPLDAPIRLLAALVAQTATEERSQLPAWLAPVQLRFVPIEPEHVPHCETLAEAFEAAGIRVDIDDRDLPVSERLRASETAWVPFDAVVGDEEVETDTLGVTIRVEGTERPFSPGELRDHIRAELDGWPRAPLPFARRHSQRSALLDTD